MKTNHQNKMGTALITGASTGIGATYAERLAKRGYDLILVARDQKKLAILAKQLNEEAGIRTEAFQADLTSKSDLALVERRLRDDHEITMLVNNAGMSVEGSLVGGDLDKIETMIQLNVTAATRLAGAVAPAFVARGSGTIVNISSVLALAPELFGGVYSGTKAYLLNLSLSLDKEIGPKGVRIQVVLPGATLTAIWEKAGKDVTKLPPGVEVMGVEEMVDAALVGLDLGEVVTIPSLPDASDWEALNTARQALKPKLSRAHAADRYKTAILA